MPAIDTILIASFVLICAIAAVYAKKSNERLSEADRVAYWHEHHKYWPPRWQEESDSFKRRMDEREADIMALTGGDERWENWMQFVSSRLVPKFTHRGFDVIETPKPVHEKLANAVNKGLEKWQRLRIEHRVPLMYGPQSKFIDLNSLAWEVIEDLKELHEEWAGGIKLFPTSAYGVRMYQNGSSLAMHVDKVQTHVISSIVHITHKYDNDSEPWPIQIEDHDGNVHAYGLEPGQMLFYESARCPHGRLTELKGEYYGSIFLHYQPVDRSIWDFTTNDIINAIPPHWRDGIMEDKGSRHSGQGYTFDSRAAVGVPPRVVAGEYVHDIKSPHAYLETASTFDLGEL